MSRVLKTFTRALYTCTLLRNDEFTNIINVGPSDRLVQIFVCELSIQIRFHVAHLICTDETVSITFKHFENFDEFSRQPRSAMRSEMHSCGMICATSTLSSNISLIPLITDPDVGTSSKHGLLTLFHTSASTFPAGSSHCRSLASDTEHCSLHTTTQTKLCGFAESSQHPLRHFH